MSELRHCGCTICSIERGLEEYLGTRAAQQAYTTMFGGFPSLACFPTTSSLLVHLRGIRHLNGSGEASDKIFRTLREGLGETGEISEALLLLAIVPALHTTVSSLARAFPMLDREDVAQQAIVIFIMLANSKDWRRRNTYLAFALTRELRRAVSLWVRKEARRVPEPTNGMEPELAISAADLFERDVQLRHFLARSRQSGALSDDDLNLLVEFKLEGGMEERRNRPATNAVRQRMKRLLSKMRRHARGGHR
jgi:hypothetical protein